MHISGVIDTLYNNINNTLQNVIHCSTPISCHCAHFSCNLFHPIINAQSACRCKCADYVVKDNKELLGIFNKELLGMLYMVEPVSLIS